MDTILPISNAPVIPVSVPTPAPVVSASTSTTSAPTAAPILNSAAQQIQNAQADEQKRLAQLERAAASFVGSNQTFTIYKEGAQYITRYTNHETGKVTYIPEPKMLPSGSGNIVYMTV